MPYSFRRTGTLGGGGGVRPIGRNRVVTAAPLSCTPFLGSQGAAPGMRLVLGPREKTVCVPEMGH